MGIRLNKMCGYALTDIGQDDPRVNPESPAWKHELDGEVHLEGYLEELGRSHSSTIDRSLVSHMRSVGEPLPDVQDAIQWGTADGGLERVLCLRPPLMGDWHRKGDTLDWLENAYTPWPSATSARDDAESWDRVAALPHGIHPWAGSYMDDRTGERLPGDVMNWVRLWHNADDAKKAELAAKAQDVLDEMCERFGMTQREAEEHVAPTVPEEVRALASYAELFTGDAVWRQLRPVLYVWWA